MFVSLEIKHIDDATHNQAIGGYFELELQLTSPVVKWDVIDEG